MKRRASVVVVLLFVAVLPSRASAHPEVDRASAEVTNGNYEAAEPLLQALLQRDDLDLAALTTVLELRAALYRATGNNTGLDTALRSLAAIAPDHRFGPRFPPDLEARAAEIRRSTGRLGVRTQILPSPVGVRLVAEAVNDGEHLVRALQYRVFDVAAAQWVVASPPLEAAPGREVLAFVEAIGPGGAVIASEGSADAPLRVQGPSLDETQRSAPAAPADEGWIPWVVGGVVLAVLAGVAIGLGVGLADSGSVTWQPGAPRQVP